MKKILMILMVSLVLALSGQAEAKTSLLDEIVSRGSLRVGFSSFVPWAMQDKSGNFIGFEVDVAKRLAEDLGVSLQLVPTRWSGIIPGLLTGKFDLIIGGMSVTSERNIKLNFTIPYDYASVEAVANRDKAANFKFPEDYNKPEIIVAMRTGSTAVLPVKKLLPKATLRLFDDEATSVQELLSGRAHILFASAPLPAFETLRNPNKLFRPTGEKLMLQPVGMAVPKGDVDILNFLDNWIRTVEAQNWLKERKDYWFNGVEWENQIR